MSSPEEERTRLIRALVSLLREHAMPDECRAAGLTLIGYLARRMPGESSHAAGVCEMQAMALARITVACGGARASVAAPTDAEGPHGTTVGASNFGPAINGVAVIEMQEVRPLHSAARADDDDPTACEDSAPPSGRRPARRRGAPR